MTDQPGQIGVNPVPYDFTRWEEYDPFGRKITNDRIEHVKRLILAVYSDVPDFESHGKENVDAWVQEQLKGAEGDEDTIAALNTTLHSHFIAAVKIKSGFFEGHTIIIKDIAIDHSNGRTRIDFSGTEPSGKVMEKPAALEFVVNSVVKLLMLEQALVDEIDAEKEKRIAG